MLLLKFNTVFHWYLHPQSNMNSHYMLHNNIVYSRDKKRNLNYLSKLSHSHITSVDICLAVKL